MIVFWPEPFTCADYGSLANPAQTRTVGRSNMKLVAGIMGLAALALIAVATLSTQVRVIMLQSSLIQAGNSRLFALQ
jgi:hypothetical protein